MKNVYEGIYDFAVLLLTFRVDVSPAETLKTVKIKELWHKCFPVNFAKFLRTPFLTEHLR